MKSKYIKNHKILILITICIIIILTIVFSHRFISTHNNPCRIWGELIYDGNISISNTDEAKELFYNRFYSKEKAEKYGQVEEMISHKEQTFQNEIVEGWVPIPPSDLSTYIDKGKERIKFDGFIITKEGKIYSFSKCF